MVAQWTANGDNGLDGDPALYHVVAEPKYHQGLSSNKHKMEEAVLVPQLEIGHAIQKVVQWTANGDSGQDGDLAQ